MMKRLAGALQANQYKSCPDFDRVLRFFFNPKKIKKKFAQLIGCAYICSRSTAY